MNKKCSYVLLTIIVLISLSACSFGAPKIKCGIYRSASSDAYIEVFDDNTIQIMNCDLSTLEKILEDDTIDLAELDEADAKDLRDSWNLNRDFTNKKMEYVIDDEFYKQTGNIGITFPLSNPYNAGAVSWGISYYPAEKKMLIEAESLTTDEHVSEVFVLEK